MMDHSQGSSALTLTRQSNASLGLNTFISPNLFFLITPFSMIRPERSRDTLILPVSRPEPP